MKNLDRRSFMLGIAAIAAVGPAIVEAVAAPVPLGTVAMELEEYTSANLLAAFLLDGEPDGPMQECNGHLVVTGNECNLVLDRELRLPPPDPHSGVARVRFINKIEPRIWGEFDVNAMSGCVVNIKPAILHGGVG